MYGMNTCNMLTLGVHKTGDCFQLKPWSKIKSVCIWPRVFMGKNMVNEKKVYMRLTLSHLLSTVLLMIPMFYQFHEIFRGHIKKTGYILTLSMPHSSALNCLCVAYLFSKPSYPSYIPYGEILWCSIQRKSYLTVSEITLKITVKIIFHMGM